MINAIAITNENQLETGISINNLNLKDYKWFWVDFSEPTEEEIKQLDETFHFHPLAIEDCIHRLQRPKLDYYNGYTFYVTHAVKAEEKEFIKEEVNFFICDHFIVSYHRKPIFEVKQVWDQILSQKDITRWDPYYVFYLILDKIVDNYFPLIYSIEDELDNIEDNTDKKSMNRLMEELFDARHMLLNLRHTVNPMRDLLYRMLNSHRLDGILERREYFADIYDHLIKLSDMIMSNREVTADIRDSYLSMYSHQTNNVMKVLTIITSIFAPLTFLAGIYGMNFEFMPELTWKYGYFIVLGLMGVLAIIMYLWFKKKGWF
jgi:magnesium transporter